MQACRHLFIHTRYDADGNETAKFIDVHHTGVLSAGDTNVTQYTWDADKRLVEVTTSAVAGGPVMQVVVYLYDAEERWLGENIENGSGVVTHETRFVYDGNQIVLQFDESGSGQMTNANLSHRYLWGPAVDQLLSDEQLSASSSGQGYNVAAPGTVVWPLTDNVGTVRDLAICDLTTGTTSIVNHLDYSSFGQVLSQTNPATGNTAAVDCLFGFAGLPFDQGSGTFRTPARPYDPVTGRWIEPYPTGFKAGDTNLYRYVGNSPTDAVDPSGLAAPWVPILPSGGRTLTGSEKGIVLEKARKVLDEMVASGEITVARAIYEWNCSKLHLITRWGSVQERNRATTTLKRSAKTGS